MSETIELSYVWDHTITIILNYDLKSEMVIKIKEWVVFNKLEDFSSLLNYIDDDFTPTGSLCYTNDNGEKLHHIPMQEFTSSDGSYNISLIKMDMNMVIMFISIL